MQTHTDTYKVSGYNGKRTHNHLVHKRTLNYLAKLAYIQTYKAVEITDIYRVMNNGQIPKVSISWVSGPAVTSLALPIA